MGPIIVISIAFLLMWVLFIVPQQKRLRAHRAMLTRLEVGDEVMMASGLYGTVTALDDDVASLEIAPGTVVRSARGAIARRLSEEAETGADSPDSPDSADSPDIPDTTEPVDP